MKNVKKKLDKMLAGKEHDIYVLAIISNLFEQGRDNPALAEAILNEDKNWDGLWKYIMDNARKEAKNGCACVEDEKVYAWAVEYFLEETPPEPKIEPPKAIPVERKRTTPRPRPVQAETAEDNKYGQLRMVF